MLHGRQPARLWTHCGSKVLSNRAAEAAPREPQAAPRARERYERAAALGTMYSDSESVRFPFVGIVEAPTHVAAALGLASGVSACGLAGEMRVGREYAQETERLQEQNHEDKRSDVTRELGEIGSTVAREGKERSEREVIEKQREYVRETRERALREGVPRKFDVCTSWVVYNPARKQDQRELVFTSRRSTPLEPRNFNRIRYSGLQCQKGIDRSERPHRKRHREAPSNGKSLRTVQ